MQFGVFVHSWYHQFKSHGGLARNGASFGPKRLDEWKEGDRFTLIIDFENRIMSLMFNDEYIGIVHGNIPNEVVPTINIFARMELKCTKYEVV